MKQMRVAYIWGVDMEEEKILEAVISKAVKNGWKIKRFLTAQEMDEFKAIGGLALLNWTNRHWAFIFDHSFAKAFFGEKGKTVYVNVDDNPYKLVNWQYHLQQLAISEDRLEYLEKYLKK